MSDPHDSIRPLEERLIDAALRYCDLDADDPYALDRLEEAADAYNEAVRPDEVRSDAE
jgi:hypothetical protein